MCHTLWQHPLLLHHKQAIMIAIIKVLGVQNQVMVQVVIEAGTLLPSIITLFI